MQDHSMETTSCIEGISKEYFLMNIASYHYSCEHFPSKRFPQSVSSKMLPSLRPPLTRRHPSRPHSRPITIASRKVSSIFRRHTLNFAAVTQLDLLR